jgi:hypothetical protein
MPFRVIRGTFHVLGYSPDGEGSVAGFREFLTARVEVITILSTAILRTSTPS